MKNNICIIVLFGIVLPSFICAISDYEEALSFEEFTGNKPTSGLQFQKNNTPNTSNTPKSNAPSKPAALQNSKEMVTPKLNPNAIAEQQRKSMQAEGKQTKVPSIEPSKNSETVRFLVQKQKQAHEERNNATEGSDRVVDNSRRLAVSLNEIDSDPTGNNQDLGNNNQEQEPITIPIPLPGIKKDDEGDFGRPLGGIVLEKLWDNKGKVGISIAGLGLLGYLIKKRK